jgi:hypothetical protein
MASIVRFLSCDDFLWMFPRLTYIILALMAMVLALVHALMNQNLLIATASPSVDMVSMKSKVFAYKDLLANKMALVDCTLLFLTLVDLDQAFVAMFFVLADERTDFAMTFATFGLTAVDQASLQLMVYVLALMAMSYLKLVVLSLALLAMALKTQNFAALALPAMPILTSIDLTVDLDHILAFGFDLS